MLTGLSHLGLEVKYLDRAREFYENSLLLSPSTESETDVAYAVGETSLVLRRPTRVPRGGVHVHYAFTTPESQYDEWLALLADFDPQEVSFGSYRSLYVDDPDDHCVEIGGMGDSAGGSEGGEGGEGHAGDRGSGSDEAELTGIFEVVLEVETLASATRFYEALGFEVVDRGDERRRVRLRAPENADNDSPAWPLDVELWEPQLGLADARGGVHVDLGFAVDDAESAVKALGGWVDESVTVDGGLRVRDPDGHYLTFVTE